MHYTTTSTILYLIKVFLNSLTKAEITPVVKNYKQFLKNTYRDVSILPNVSKVYEPFTTIK